MSRLFEVLFFRRENVATQAMLGSVRVSVYISRLLQKILALNRDMGHHNHLYRRVATFGT